MLRTFRRLSRSRFFFNFRQHCFNDPNPNFRSSGSTTIPMMDLKPCEIFVFSDSEMLTPPVSVSLRHSRHFMRPLEVSRRYFSPKHLGRTKGRRERNKNNRHRGVIFAKYFVQHFMGFVLIWCIIIKLFHKFNLHAMHHTDGVIRRGVTKTVSMVEGVGRFVRCWAFLGRFFVSYNLRKMYFLNFRKLPREDFEKHIEGYHALTAQRMVKLFLSLSGLFVKFGQVMAMMPYLPDVYQTTLRVLHDRVEPIPWEKIRKFVEKEIIPLDEGGATTLEDIFSELCHTPIAAASLAQVYRWRLRHTGEWAAVKVQYPYAEYYLQGDQRIQRTGLKILALIDRQYRGMEKRFKEQFRMFRLELDFKNEANNQMRCRREFSKCSFATAPMVFADFSTKKVLIMEHIEGCKLTDLEQIKKMGLKTSDVARSLFHAFALMIFQNGFVHGDLHAGNILVRQQRKYGKRPSPEIVFLDHGLYTKLDDTFRRGYAGFWTAMVRGDSSEVRRFVVDELGIRNVRMYVSMNTMQKYDGVSVLRDAMAEQVAQNKNNTKFFLPKEWVGKMREMAKDRQGRRYRDFRQLIRYIPQQSLFIIRSSFSLGFINSALGAPVNRFSVMARVAFESGDDMREAGWVARTWKRTVFDLRLWYEDLKSRVFTFLANLYIKWGDVDVAQMNEETMKKLF